LPLQKEHCLYRLFIYLLISLSKPSTVSPSLLEIIVSYICSSSSFYASYGGNGTFNLIMRMPDKFAAAIPICGWADTSKAASIKHIPMWVFHGVKDNIIDVEYSQRIVKAVEEAGGKPVYTEYPEVYHAVG
jgi:predicted peptidase